MANDEHQNPRPGHPVRPTIAVLNQLVAAGGWGNPEQQAAVNQRQFRKLAPLHAIAHDIVERAARIGITEFENGPTIAWTNRIQCVTQEGIKPPWFELRSNQWRGAVTNPDRTDSYWLVFTGLRRQGDRANIYDVLERMSKQDLQRWNPTDQDRTLFRLETEDDKILHWKRDIVTSVLDAIASLDLDNSSAPPLSIPVAPEPNGAGAMTLTIEIEQARNEDIDAVTLPATVSVALRMQNWQDDPIRRIVLTLITSIFEPTFENWEPMSSADGRELIYCTMISVARVHHLAVMSKLGEGPDSNLKDLLPELIAVTHGHYTSKDRLTDAIVLGIAVRALCGQIFMPTQNPDDKPVCSDCKAHWEQLTE